MSTFVYFFSSLACISKRGLFFLAKESKMSAKGKDLILMDEETIERSITRIAYEILESNRGSSDLALIGIVTRGDLLAQQLATRISKIEGHEVPVGKLDISFYRDDFAINLSPVVHTTEINFDIKAKTIILVDDVLYTGRTIRAALDAIMDFGRPKAIQLACLVDRGHRELPIRADYVGKNIPSARSERVKVFLKEIDGESSVRLFTGERP